MTEKYIAAGLLYVIVTTILLVNGDPVDHKRHYASTQKPRSGRPMTEAPFCRSVCDNITRDCSDNCHKGRDTDAYKYRCMYNCIEAEDEPITFTQETCDNHPNTAASQRPQATEQTEIDVSKLTMADRCHMEAYENTTVCDFDRENPAVSRQVFHVNKPKLTLCTGSPVLKSKRGLITKERKKSFSAEERRNGDANSRPERSIHEEQESLVGRLKKNNKGKSDAGDLPTATYDGDEFCPTFLNYESPSTAKHLTTSEIVDLYFYAGYSQWFQLGSCDSSTPKKNIGGGFESHCDVVYTAAKAWIVINPKEFKKRSKVKNCGTVKHSKYLICYDWVLLPTHCKHFFKPMRA